MTGAAQNTSSFVRRKAPRQQRSRVTVDAIKQAAEDLARKQGFKAGGTHEIAARAGVSIGSLYQYFPNRESIYLSLHEQTVAMLVQEIKSDMPSMLDAPLPEAVRATIQHLIAIYARHRLVLLDMKAELPELRLETNPMSFRAMIHGSLRVFLAQRTGSVSAAENETRAYFLEQIILGTIQSYLAEVPTPFTEKAFVDHLTAIVLSYLRMSPPARRTRSLRK